MASSSKAARTARSCRGLARGAVLLLLVPACEDVVGHPIVQADAGMASGGSAGTSSLGGGGSAAMPFPNSLAGFGPLSYPSLDDPSTTLGGGVPATEYCSEVYNWPAADIVFELSFLDNLNLLRLRDGVCGSAAGTASLQPLTMSEELRCAARLHSLHTVANAPTGLTPIERMRLSGYSAAAAAEVVAITPPETRPYMVLEQLIGAAGVDCASLFDPNYVDVGVGLAQGVWTVDLATK